MKEFATCLFGSQNYHLDLSASDHDYVHIVTPDFDDFYNDRNLARAIQDDHNSSKDIRKFTSLLLKGNFNAIELLFSTDCTFHNDDAREYFRLAREGFGNGYLITVFPHFLHSVKGMAFTENLPSRKQLARAKFLSNFASYVLQRYAFCVSPRLWREPGIWGYPAAFRKEEQLYPDGVLTLGQIANEFSAIEDKSRFYIDIYLPHFIDYATQFERELENLTKKIVKKYI